MSKRLLFYRRCDAAVSNRWILGYHYCRNKAKWIGFVEGKAVRYCTRHHRITPSYWRQIAAAAGGKGKAT